MYKVNIKEGNKNRTIEREKLLTIGIITKNEPERLERCLKSLIPIREAIDCEIIVTDTGSTDNTVEVAEKYADKVLHFEWCDDFAAARNTGIDEAKGLWFMWIDSDEWIEKPEPLIEFFRSGEYKKHFTANFDFVNLLDYDKDIKNKVSLFRMMLLHESFKFKGRVHEQTSRVDAGYNLKTFIYHDGYIFIDIEEKNKKHLRNIKLLEESFHDNLDNYEIIRYIVDQYRFNEEYGYANEYCDKAISILESKKDRNHFDKAYKLYFLIMKASNYYEIMDYRNAIEILEVLKDDDNLLSYLFVDIYAILFFSYMRQGNIIRATEYGEKFLDYYICLPKFKKMYMSILLTQYGRNDITRNIILYYIDNFDNNQSSDVTIYKCIEIIEGIRTVESELDEQVSVYNYLSDILRFANKINKFEIIINTYMMIEKNNSEYIEFFESNIIQYMINNRELCDGMISSLSKINSKRMLIRLSKVISDSYCFDNKETEEKLEDILEEEISDINIISEIIYLSIKNKINFRKFRKHLDIFNSNLYVKSIIFGKEDYLNNIIEYYDVFKEETNSIEFLYFIVSVIEGLRIDKRYNEGLILKIYNIYKEVLPKIIGDMYNCNIINENTVDIYPPLHRFGYFIGRANQFEKAGDIFAYLGEMKKAVLHFPTMADAVKEEIQNMESELENENERQKELNDLAENIKHKLYELITQGRDTEAIGIALQLKVILPNDSEIKEICSRLNVT